MLHTLFQVALIGPSSFVFNVDLSKCRVSFHSNKSFFKKQYWLLSHRSISVNTGNKMPSNVNLFLNTYNCRANFLSFIFFYSAFKATEEGPRLCVQTNQCRTVIYVVCACLVFKVISKICAMKCPTCKSTNHLETADLTVKLYYHCVSSVSLKIAYAENEIWKLF